MPRTRFFVLHSRTPSPEMKPGDSARLLEGRLGWSALWPEWSAALRATEVVLSRRIARATRHPTNWDRQRRVHRRHALQSRTDASAGVIRASSRLRAASQREGSAPRRPSRPKREPGSLWTPAPSSYLASPPWGRSSGDYGITTRQFEAAA